MYDNETYLASLAQARSDIDRHVRNTQDEVTRQQGVNRTQAGLIPGATGAVAAGSATRSVGDASALGGMLHQGLGSLAGRATTSLGQNNQATLATLGAQQGAFASMAPLLQQGFDEQAQQRQGQVQGIASQLYADNDAQAMDYRNARAAEDRGYAAQAQEAEASRAHAANLAAQQLSAAAAEAQAQREFEAGQAEADRLFQILMANPTYGQTASQVGPSGALGPAGQPNIVPSTNSRNRAF